MSLDVCSACGCTGSDAVACGGSYVIRCSQCGNTIVATTLECIVDEDTHVGAEVDPKGDRDRTIIAAMAVLNLSRLEVEQRTPLLDPADDTPQRIVAICARGGSLLLRFG
jgi:hypothetical protein